MKIQKKELATTRENAATDNHNINVVTLFLLTDSLHLVPSFVSNTSPRFVASKDHTVWSQNGLNQHSEDLSSRLGTVALTGR